MKIISPSFLVCDRDEQRGGLRIIEEAGRLCYKSEDKSTDASAEAFVRGLIKRKHLSVLEHGDMIFEIGDRHVYENVANSLQIIRDSGHQAPMLEMSSVDWRCIVSGNMRAWLELFASGSIASRYFIGYFDPVFIQDMGFTDEDAKPDDRVRQIHYADLRDPLEKLVHLRQTVKFTVDRGVTHELLNLGLLSEEARDVLPYSTKAELMVTGALSVWDHFFDLRARQITGKAHPQAAEVAVPLYELFKVSYPGIII